MGKDPTVKKPIECCRLCKFCCEMSKGNFRCRRFSPTIYSSTSSSYSFATDSQAVESDVDASFPWVAPEDWCGEYKNSME